ncbi:CDP-alcohol phosphatidyltransferase family protein [Puia dinghuensis]|uniref:CDP-alcohol phosphatidyltransferase family protein n=1 Tax=Puia dinghuensis TaxID=1792502 RepID=UPI00166C8529|nr:CDP-alcohol phosphatidyltransferase family protein [Puia dinghuensis]
MAGTRIVIAKYLGSLKVDSDVIDRMMKMMVGKPEYPAFSAISSFLNECSIECEIINNGLPVLCDDMCIARVKAEDFTVVLILQATSERVKYLTSQGNVIVDSFDQFCTEYQSESIRFKVSDLNAVKDRVQELEDKSKNEAPIDASIGNIRRLSKLNEPPIYRFCRFFSIYFSYVFIRMKIQPNHITFLWLVAIAGASFSFSLGNWWGHQIVGALLILLGYTFDCSDGEVARVTKTYSKIGVYLDTIAHSTSGLFIILGITLGTYNSINNPGILKVGLICMFGDSMFNYLFRQLNSWSGQNSVYGLFHPILMPLIWLFPIDLNLFLVGAILNQSWASLRIWEIGSIILSGFMMLIFFLHEYVYEKGYMKRINW